MYDGRSASSPHVAKAPSNADTHSPYEEKLGTGQPMLWSLSHVAAMSSSYSPVAPPDSDDELPPLGSMQLPSTQIRSPLHSVSFWQGSPAAVESSSSPPPPLRRGSSPHAPTARPSDNERPRPHRAAEAKEARLVTGPV